MHGGKVPRGPKHGAFIHGRETIETRADRRKAEELRVKSNTLMAEAIHARFGVIRKLQRGLIGRDEAVELLIAVERKIDVAMALRKEAFELEHAYIDRYRNDGPAPARKRRQRRDREGGDKSFKKHPRS